MGNNFSNVTNYFSGKFSPEIETQSKNKLVLVANLTPTPYLIIKPNCEYFFMPITSLENTDYSKVIKSFYIEDNHQFDLCYSSQHYTNEVNILGCKISGLNDIKGNILIRKYKDNQEITITSSDIDHLQSLLDT